MTILLLIVFGALLLVTALSASLAFLAPWIAMAILLWLAYIIGRAIDGRNSFRFVKYLLPTAMVGVPALWGLLAYKDFERLCNSTPTGLQKHGERHPQTGFLIDDTNMRNFDARKTVGIAAYLYDQGSLTYFDQVSVGGFGVSQRAIFRQSKQSNSNVAEPPSEYAFRVAPIESVPNRWHGPLFQVTYSVVSATTNQSVQSQSEHVFGGGIIGNYMHALLGERGDYSDKDFQYLSCGYASRRPAAWRPRFTSNVNRQNYVRADLELLSSILP